MKKYQTKAEDQNPNLIQPSSMQTKLFMSQEAATLTKTAPGRTIGTVSNRRNGNRLQIPMWL